MSRASTCLNSSFPPPTRCRSSGMKKSHRRAEARLPAGRGGRRPFPAQAGDRQPAGQRHQIQSDRRRDRALDPGGGWPGRAGSGGSGTGHPRGSVAAGFRPFLPCGQRPHTHGQRRGPGPFHRALDLPGARRHRRGRQPCGGRLPDHRAPAAAGGPASPAVNRTGTPSGQSHSKDARILHDTTGVHRSDRFLPPDETILEILSSSWSPSSVIAVSWSAGTFWRLQPRQRTRRQRRPVTVAAARVERGTLARTIRLSAEFRAYQEVDLHARVSGFIKSIPVDIGDRVKQGDTLATLEVPELQEDLNKAQAAVDAANENVHQADANYQGVHLGLHPLAAGRAGASRSSSPRRSSTPLWPRTNPPPPPWRTPGSMSARRRPSRSARARWWITPEDHGTLRWGGHPALRRRGRAHPGRHQLRRARPPRWCVSRRKTSCGACSPCPSPPSR